MKKNKYNTWDKIGRIKKRLLQKNYYKIMKHFGRRICNFSEESIREIEERYL